MHQSRRLTAAFIAIPLFLLAGLAIVLQLRSSLLISETGPVEFADASFNWALALILTVILAVKRRSASKTPVPWLLLTIAGWAWLAADLSQVEDSLVPRIVADDIVTLLVWIMTIAAIIPALGSTKVPASSKLLLGLGLALQSIAFTADLGDGSIFHFPGISDPVMSAIDESFETLCLAAYVGGLLLIAIPLLFDRPGLAGRRLWSFLQSTPGRAAAIIWEDASWLIWRMRHPGESFAGYYANSIKRKLDRGAPHRTLGQFEWSSKSPAYSQGNRAAQFSGEGLRVFRELLPLRPQAGAVIDYGCGSLRIGQHFIDLLGPGEYWGLDITERFFNDGVAMLPENMIAAKAPELHVIGTDSLARAAAAKPGLVYSVAVMQHVPRAELATYWGNILALLQPRSVAVVNFDMAEKEMRTGGKNWAYTEMQVRSIIASIRPGMPLRFETRGSIRSFAGKQFHRARVIAGPMAAS